MPTVDVRTVREAAEAIVRTLGMRFGYVEIRVKDGEVEILRHGSILPDQANILELKPP
jgi:hypothetical protein